MLGHFGKTIIIGAVILSALGCSRGEPDDAAARSPAAVGLPARRAERHTLQKPAESDDSQEASRVVAEAATVADEANSLARASAAEHVIPTAGDEPTAAEEVAVIHPAEFQLRVRLETTLGDVVVELWPQSAPKTVANFLDYVDDGHYTGTIVHQIVPGRMILAGGFSEELEEKSVGPPIDNESNPERSNRRGTLAMARPFDRIHGATCQFFINLADNPTLDHRSQMPEEFGYCVFGEVVEGLDVVDRIGQAETHNTLRFELLPVEPIVIRQVERVDDGNDESATSHVARRPTGTANVPPRKTR